MTKVDTSRPNSPFTAEASGSAKVQDAQRPFGRLPPELLTSILLSFDSYDRNPLQLSQWRTVSKDFQTTVDHNVFWRDFAPRTTPRERLYQDKLKAATRQLVEVATDMQSLDLDENPRTSELYADVRAKSRRLVDEQQAPNELYREFLQRRSAAHPAQDKLLRKIWSGAFTFGMRPGESSAEHSERRNNAFEQLRTTKEEVDKLGAPFPACDLDASVALAHHGDFDEIHPDIAMSPFHRSVGLQHILSNDGEGWTDLGRWPSNFWTRSNAVLAMSSEITYGLVRYDMPAKILQDKSIFAELRQFSEAWVAIDDASEDVVSNREKMRWWDDFVRSHPGAPISLGLYLVFRAAQNHTEELYRLRHMYQVRPEILENENGYGKRLYSDFFTSFNQAMEFWPAQIRMPCDKYRLIRMIEQENVQVEERIMMVMQRAPEFYEGLHWSPMLRDQESLILRLSEYAISLAKQDPEKYCDVLSLAEEDQRRFLPPPSIGGTEQDKSPRVKKLLTWRKRRK